MRAIRKHRLSTATVKATIMMKMPLPMALRGQKPNANSSERMPKAIKVLSILVLILSNASEAAFTRSLDFVCGGFSSPSSTMIGAIEEF